MAAELRKCLDRGEFDGLAAAYAPDAALDASLPGGACERERRPPSSPS
jgi:hypothetical protein